MRKRRGTGLFSTELFVDALALLIEKTKCSGFIADKAWEYRTPAKQGDGRKQKL